MKESLHPYQRGLCTFLRLVVGVLWLYTNCSSHLQLVIEQVDEDDTHLRKSPVRSSTQQPFSWKKSSFIPQRVGSPRLATSNLGIPPNSGSGVVCPFRTSSPQPSRSSTQVPAGTIVQNPTTGLRRTPTRCSARTITIPRGARGFGFTMRAMDVFYGTSSMYTLHQVIERVDQGGPAYAVGLRQNDVVLRVNGNEITGRLNVEAIQLMCKVSRNLMFISIKVNLHTILIVYLCY